MKQLNAVELEKEYREIPKEVKHLLQNRMYYHPNGGIYKIIDLAKNKTVNGDWVTSVVYAKIKNDSELFTRTLEDFCERFEEIEKENIVTFELPRSILPKLIHHPDLFVHYNVFSNKNGNINKVSVIDNGLFNEEKRNLTLFTNNEHLVEWNKDPDNGGYNYRIEISISGGQQSKPMIEEDGFEITFIIP